MVFQAEKTLADYGDRIPVELRGELDGKVQTVKEIDPDNADRLRPAYDEMVQTPTRVGASMYEAAEAAGADGTGGAGAGFGENGGADAGAGAEDEATVEGEFREVGADR